jgi:EAL and modified HD-GYP domain-containing signal transduction protein
MAPQHPLIPGIAGGWEQLPMNDTEISQKQPVSVSIGRQPVFDEKRRLWGYELYCVGNAGSEGSGFPDEESVAVSVASSAYLALQQIVVRGKKILVNFSEKGVLENLPYALPPVLAAVKVAENLGSRPPVREVLNRLKSDGYLIAVADFTGDPHCNSFYDMADIIGLDVAGRGTEEVPACLSAARSFGALLLASRVDTPLQFKACREAGFSLFHGAFFKLPDLVTVRKLTSNEVLRFNLLRFIEEEDPDFGKLADGIQSDVTISFRLLAYLNSAAFAFCERIKSIRQAISLLGWRNVKNWLRVVLLTDMSRDRDAQELVLLSAQRGMFLELVAREHDFWGFNPESLHLLGLFSFLDTLLAIPMTEVVTHLPIDNRLKAALCREPNNEYLPLLWLAQCLEEANWTEGESMIQRLNLEGGKVRSALQASINWANDLAALHSVADPSPRA